MQTHSTTNSPRKGSNRYNGKRDNAVYAGDGRICGYVYAVDSYPQNYLWRKLAPDHLCRGQLGYEPTVITQGKALQAAGLGVIDLDGMRLVCTWDEFARAAHLANLGRGPQWIIPLAIFTPIGAPKPPAPKPPTPPQQPRLF